MLLASVLVEAYTPRLQPAGTRQQRRAAVTTASESPPPFSLTRKGALRLAVLSAYPPLLYAISKAEEDPAYATRVARTIASAVPTPDLRVLEIGIGRAANLELYPRGTQLVGLDATLPGSAQRADAEERAKAFGLGGLSWVEGDVAALPFGVAEFDAVVATKVFCSVRSSAAISPPRAPTCPSQHARGGSVPGRRPGGGAARGEPRAGAWRSLRLRRARYPGLRYRTPG